MRPRYRVWDKEEKKMIYDAENTYDGYPVSYVTSFGGILKCPDFFDVMQYTGIKDIHCCRIFEKDIVSFTASKRNYKGIVEWDSNAASYVLKAKDHYNEYFNEVDNLKVLGNIYEDKELLDA